MEFKIRSGSTINIFDNNINFEDITELHKGQEFIDQITQRMNGKIKTGKNIRIKEDLIPSNLNLHGFDSTIEFNPSKPYISALKAIDEISSALATSVSKNGNYATEAIYTKQLAVPDNHPGCFVSYIEPGMIPLRMVVEYDIRVNMHIMRIDFVMVVL